MTNPSLQVQDALILNHKYQSQNYGFIVNLSHIVDLQIITENMKGRKANHVVSIKPCHF